LVDAWTKPCMCEPKAAITSGHCSAAGVMDVCSSIDLQMSPVEHAASETPHGIY